MCRLSRLPEAINTQKTEAAAQTQGREESEQAVFYKTIASSVPKESSEVQSLLSQFRNSLDEQKSELAQDQQTGFLV